MLMEKSSFKEVCRMAKRIIAGGGKMDRDLAASAEISFYRIKHCTASVQCFDAGTERCWWWRTCGSKFLLVFSFAVKQKARSSAERKDAGKVLRVLRVE